MQAMKVVSVFLYFSAFGAGAFSVMLSSIGFSLLVPSRG
jgi:hypothetical protein